MSFDRISSLFFLLLIVSPLTAYGQGKIAGRVTEAQTREALIGVNVVVEGRQQGAVTDVDGNYVIVNVRPGQYTIVFSYIGFSTKKVSGVRVSTGQTTRYDIELSEQVIEGEEIIVQADRPLIQKDLTASSKTVIADEIDALPVESFFGVLFTQAGVNRGPGGEIHIRGGRSNEISYLVDGISVANPFSTNGLATGVSNDAIQEMTVISGAFNAEYGKAMSGIVNLVTKEGGDEYHGSISAWGGDTFTDHGDIFFTPSGVAVRNYTLEASLSGPIPFFKKVRFFASGRYDDDDGYLYGRREHSPGDSANFNGDPWYYELNGTPVSELTGPVDAELVPMNPSENKNLIVKLSGRLFPKTKLEYSFLIDNDDSKSFNFSYRFNPDGVASSRDRSRNHSLHFTHTLNESTFYTLRFSSQNYKAETFLYEDPLDPRYASTGSILGFPGNNFLFGGDQKGHVREAATTYRAKADLTKQVGTVHEVKAGVEAELNSLDRDNFVVLFDGDTFRRPTVPDVTSPAHDRYENQRVELFSIYAQDKLEFDNFIINAGLRLERFAPNAPAIADLFDPMGDVVDAETRHYILPRVGVSFPITDSGILHFSYGHFAQMPALRNLFVNPEFEFGVGTIPTYGNAAMRPQRTVQYELGLQQQVGGMLAFDVTGFFKDIRDYMVEDGVLIRFSTVSGEDRYRIFLNQDYANIRGITFALTKRRSRNGLFSANIDYTLLEAEGGNQDSDSFFFNRESGRENELEVIPLPFDQRHIVSSTIALTRSRNWSASVIAQFSTGYPYTPLLIDQKIDDLPNSGRKPSQFDVDAHVYKEFSLDRFQLRVFAKAFNLFDRLNERFVFDDTGRATYTLNGIRGEHATWEPNYVDSEGNRNPGIHTLEEWNTRPQYYRRPREVKIGATLSF